MWLFFAVTLVRSQLLDVPLKVRSVCFLDPKMLTVNTCPAVYVTSNRMHCERLPCLCLKQTCFRIGLSAVNYVSELCWVFCAYLVVLTTCLHCVIESIDTCCLSLLLQRY
jgi:hypothetical protein